MDAVFVSDTLQMIKKAIEAYYDDEDIKYKGNVDSCDTIIDFFSWLQRQIPLKKRKVFFSIRLRNKIYNRQIKKRLLDALQIFKARFENGEDMNGFLSRLTLNSSAVDNLRFTWHLYHLHINAQVALSKDDMRNNRSGYLLLAIITDNEVFFIDIIRHPKRGMSYKFFNLKHLRSIRDNGWLEKIGFQEIPMMVPGTMKTLVSDRDIFNLYQNHINIAFSFGGKGYIFVNGITSNGKPMEAVFVCNTIVRNINSLSRDYKKCDAAFLCLDKNNRLMIVITIEKITGERKDIDIISGQEIFI